MSAPRVLMVGAEWFSDLPGGLNRYLGELLAALTRAGLPARAVVVGPACGAPAGVTGVSSVTKPIALRICAIRRCVRHQSRGADVLDVHFALYGLVPLLASRARRLPLVVHFQGPWAEESALTRSQKRTGLAVRRLVEGIVYRRARVVVTLSQAFGELITEQYRVDPSRVRVLPPGIDLDRFTPGDRVAARASFGLGRDVFVVVAARRLDPRMGLDVLIDAWAQLHLAHPNSVLFVAGEGPERESLARQVALLPDPSPVHLLGRVDDDELVRLYQAADLSVVPSRALEGFGLVTLESLACGTPAVVTDSGGLPDGVQDLDPSLVVATGNAGALARRLTAAARGELPDRLACRAHAERFGWDEVARAHAELYGRVAQRPPLRVVYLDHTAVLSGGELALARLLPALDGVDAHVILAEDGPLADRLRTDGVRVEVLPMPARARNLRRDRVRPGRLPLGPALATGLYSIRLYRRLRQLRPDVVHTNSLKAAVYGGVAARLAGVPVIWHIRDRISVDYLPAGAVRAVRALAKIIPAGVIANSRTTLDTLGPLRCPSAAIPSPIDPALSDRPRDSRRNRAFTVIMVGRIAPWKGQHVFLDAFATAFPTGPERALIVGGALFAESTYEAELRTQAWRLGLADRVEFTGFTTDVAAQLDRADVLVHASVIPEPFGLVVVEAMAAGIPVIAANVGGPAEVITDGRDGTLCSPGDVSALAALLVNARYATPAASAQQVLAARTTARQYLPRVVAADIMAIYRSIHGGSR